MDPATLAHVKPGDPDPTSLYIDDDDRCPHFTWAGVRHLVVCSRMIDHDAPHIAGNGDRVLAVWR